MHSKRQFGSFLRDARKRRGYSQLCVAKALGYAGPDLISRIELGLASLPRSKIGILAKFLELSPKEIIDAKLRVIEEELYVQIEAVSGHG